MERMLGVLAIAAVGWLARPPVITLVPSEITATAGTNDTVIGKIFINGDPCPTCALAYRSTDTSRMKVVGRYSPPNQQKQNAAIVALVAPGTVKLRAGYKGVITYTQITITPKAPPDTTTTPAPKPTALVIYPKAPTIAPGGTQQFCSFVKFANGHVAMRAVDAAIPTCAQGYLTVADDAARAVTAEEQRVADLTCVKYGADGGTITSEMCPAG